MVFAGGNNGEAAATLLITPKDYQSDSLDFDMSQFQKQIDEFIEPRLAQIPGVARVDLASERPQELRITFDPHKAAALGVSLDQISNVLASSRDTSGGLANVGRRQYTVRFTGQYDLLSMAQMRVGYSGDRPIYLGDIASVERTDRLGMSGRNGKPAYYIRISRANQANTVALLNDINQAIKELNEGPLAANGLSIELSFDASVHIRNALSLVKSNLGLGVVLSCLILWLFFRGLKATLIIAATIPISLMVAFLALNIFGRSLNVISLAGLAFAVGLVLDAAIIVQENIARLRTDGIDNKKAGLTRRDVSQAYTGGLFVNEYFDGNERMNVILRGIPWQTPEELKALPIVTPQAGIQTLGELANIERTVGPTQLRRVNGRRTVIIVVTPPADMSLQQAQTILTEQVMPKVRASLPTNAGAILAGNAQKMNSAMTEMALNFVLALFILFLLMTALFKSATDSALVLLVMPLAIAGGVLALFILNLFTFQSLDLLTMIGFIILLGLVVNNAILLVDQTKVALASGLSHNTAVKQAVLLRARPVYLSTLTSLFGMLPLMLMPGVGSEIYRGLATVIVGGMAISALFTLILMPSLLQLGRNTTPASTNQQTTSAVQ